MGTSAENLPEFQEDAFDLEALAPWTRELYEHWNRLATVGPGAVERLGCLETWFIYGPSQLPEMSPHSHRNPGPGCPTLGGADSAPMAAAYSFGCTDRVSHRAPVCRKMHPAKSLANSLWYSAHKGSNAPLCCLFMIASTTGALRTRWHW